MPLFVSLDATDDEVEREVLSATCEVRMLGAKAVADLKDADIALADVVAVWHSIRMEEALFGRLKRCRAIIRMGVGYDNVDTDAAAKAGLPVCNIPDYGTEEVADTAMALILGLYRGVLAGAEKLTSGEAVRGADAIAAAVPYVRRVRGSVLGLVGLGRIGSAVALRAKACGFDVVFFDPGREDGADKALGIRRLDSLEALLQAAECVSLHCLCDESTCGLIGAQALAAMRDGALLVNTARGELIDEAAVPRSEAAQTPGG
jgi:C-terminal binding protein